MGFFIFIALVAGVFYIYWSNEKINRLEYENKKLKEKIAKYEQNNSVNDMPVKNVDFTATENIVHVENNIDSANINDTTINIPKEEKKKSFSKEDTKNTGILIVGAILIVLAAIVFLMSTWETINNIIKTGVLVLLFAVFYSFSNIAKKKYNLTKTSKAFFYISMAYIPICLISLCVFGLVGEYFSIYGKGMYIYCSISLIVTSFVYYYMYKRQNANGLFIWTLVSQLSAILLFFLTFENNIFMIFIALLVYNIILMYANFRDREKNIINNITLIVAYIVALGTITTFFEVSALKFAVFPLLALNVLLLKKKNELNTYLFSFTIYSFGVYLVLVHFIDLNKELVLLLGCGYTLLVFLAQYLTVSEKELSTSMTILGMISLALYIIMSFGVDSKLFITKTFFIASLELVIMVLSYMRSDDNWRNVFEILMPVLFVGICYNFVTTYFDYPNVPIILSIVLFVISELLIIKNKRFKKYISIITNAFMSCMFLKAVMANYNNIENDLIFISGLTLVYSYIYCKIKYKKLNDKYIIYPALVFIICIQYINETIRPIMLLVIVIITTIASLDKRKISTETIISAVFLIDYLSFVEIVYVRYLFGIIWCLVNLMVVTNIKERDILKVCIYVLALATYSNLLNDINVEYNSLFIIGITIVAFAITRTIMFRYSKDIDTVEYVVFSLIYLYALSNYANEFDGMLYVLFLVLLTFYTYTKKYGAVCLVTLFAILVNAIMLTRMFWLMIPWWIYLLGIGISLIAFAMRNESRENKENNIDKKNILKKIKDKIEE